MERQKPNSILEVEKILKLFLAILLILCLLKLPYGYYQLVRFGSFFGFLFLSYKANLSKNEKLMILFIALALLFQPFFKIALGRTIWNIVDVLVAVFLLGSIFVTAKKSR